MRGDLLIHDSNKSKYVKHTTKRLKLDWFTIGDWVYSSSHLNLQSLNKASIIRDRLKDNSYGIDPNMIIVMNKNIRALYEAGFPPLAMWLTSVSTGAYDTADLIITVLEDKVIEEITQDFFDYTSCKAVEALGTEGYLWYIDRLCLSYKSCAVNKKSALNRINLRVTLYAINSLNLACCRIPILDNLTITILWDALINSLNVYNLSQKELDNIVRTFIRLLTEK